MQIKQEKIKKIEFAKREGALRFFPDIMIALFVDLVALIGSKIKTTINTSKDRKG